MQKAISFGAAAIAQYIYQNNTSAIKERPQGSKGKAETRRSSTKICECYLVFSITSTESHTGLSKNEKKIMEF